MQLLAYSDYALRVLIYLGLDAAGDGEPLPSIEDISKAYGISKHHLTKVVQHLARAGYVDTVRGRGGGLRLAQAPELIRVGSVYRRMEGFALASCFGDRRSCAIHDACALRDVLDEALKRFLETLDEYTLADLLRKKAPLEQLLAIGAAR